MKFAHDIQFKHPAHENGFEIMLKKLAMARPSSSKREQAVLYVLSAMDYSGREDLFQFQGGYPNLSIAVERFEEGMFEERDAVLFALAMNLHNGADAFEEFGMMASATPFHFMNKLKEDTFLMNEAFQVFRNGCPLHSAA